jgi:hypothetical protein
MHLGDTYASVTFTLDILSGAGGGTRTHTPIQASDFKSDMSTIPSRPQSQCHK